MWISQLKLKTQAIFNPLLRRTETVSNTNSDKPSEDTTLESTDGQYSPTLPLTRRELMILQDCANMTRLRVITHNEEKDLFLEYGKGHLSPYTAGEIRALEDLLEGVLNGTHNNPGV
jgi:hypothetical protein